jgi:chemotaxis protein MotB
LARRLADTAEGLRIELLETESGTFFESGSPSPSPNRKELLIALAHELERLPNKISIEGHTDARPYAGWELWKLGAFGRSRKRIAPADAGKRVSANQVAQVRG